MWPDLVIRWAEEAREFANQGRLPPEFVWLGRKLSPEETRGFEQTMMWTYEPCENTYNGVEEAKWEKYIPYAEDLTQKFWEVNIK